MTSKLVTQKEQSTENGSERAHGKKKAREILSELFIDVGGLTGLVMLGYGIYQIHPPSMFIVIGIIVFILALISSKT